MKSLYETLPPVEIGGRRVGGRVLFGLLVLVSALGGATAGLLLVYTTDLPQVEALENYRPSSITELYDDRDRVIGSFALQRRVVASYEDFPPVLRDALVSIEDKDFYTHSGINFWRIVGAAYRDVESGGRVQGASTLTMQLARNLFLSPARSWPRRLRFRIRVRVLLQQARSPAHARRSRAARRLAKKRDRLFANQPRRPRAEAPQLSHQCHARRRQNPRRAGC